MNLKIIDYMWGIDRKTGERSEVKIAEETYEITSLNQGLKISTVTFTVIELTDRSVMLSIYNKKILVELDKTTMYRPRSFDAGHFYEMSLTK